MHPEYLQIPQAFLDTATSAPVLFFVKDSEVVLGGVPTQFQLLSAILCIGNLGGVSFGKITSDKSKSRRQSWAINL